MDISKVDIDSGAIDGVTLGTNSAVTEAQVDNININGNTISSTNTNGDVTIDPNGTGDVNVGNFKFDADQSVGAGQDNYVLTYDNSGGKIGLEAASGGIGGSTGVDFNDNVKARFGTGNDLEIYHTGSSSFIDDVGDGSFALRSNGFGVNIMTTTGQFMGQFSVNGAATFYHNGATKFATTSSGVQTTGTLNVNGAYTLPTSDGSANQVLQTNGSGALSFATASGGGSWNLISTTTVSSSASAVNFTGLSNGTYYKVVLAGVKSSSAVPFLYLRVSRNSTVQTGASYKYYWEQYNPGSSSASTFGTTDTQFSIGYAPSATGGGNQTDLFIYDTTANRTTLLSRSIYADSNANSTVRVLYGTDFTDTSNAIDGLSFLLSAGTIEAGTFSLYSLVTS